MANNNVGAPSSPLGGYGALSSNRGLTGPGDRLQHDLIEISHAVERTRVETLSRMLNYVDLGESVSGATAIEISDGFSQLAVMSGNAIISLTNIQQHTAGELLLELKTNGHTVTWGSPIFWLPSGSVPSTTLNRSYLLQFYLMKDVWWGQLRGYRS